MCRSLFAFGSAPTRPQHATVSQRKSDRTGMHRMTTVVPRNSHSETPQHSPWTMLASHRGFRIAV